MPTVRDDVRAYIVEHLGADDGVLIVDETEFLKKGRGSAGVQRQYTGTAGRIENSQVGVFLAYASRHGRALIDRRLYLPEQAWCQDGERRARAGVPDHVEFATKQARPGRADDRGCAGRRDHLLRRFAGAGAKGPRYYDWARIDIGADGHRHLLIRRNPTSDELAFYLCWTPRRVPLPELVRVAGTRWCNEECFQAAEGQVGMDHYQVRHWTAWHRHTTLAMLALVFLTVLAADARPTRQAEPNRPAQSSEPISLTVPEIRHLLGALLIPLTTLNKLLAWSTWRRLHQATARRSHYRRRISTPSTA
ncbi:hypothetical protein GCM10010360_71710 [Streptomyces nogalater]